jgi:predicted GNAT superfamily acetyltransferase
MTIRPLTDIAEFQGCIELQREAWGSADIDLMPARYFVTHSHIGGLVLGAFDGERLIAFVNAVPAVRDGMVYWRSNMLAVARAYWNSGIGAELKLGQRDEARQRGIHLIEWTYDPLESKNAYLNIRKLGAIVRRYYPNLYGVTTSALQQGLESDRVIAEWWIDVPRVKVEDDVRRVFIPADIQSLKKQSLKSAQDVQLRVREQFLKNLADDYFVTDFQRKDEWSEYIFVPGAAHVYQKD